MLQTRQVLMTNGHTSIVMLSETYKPDLNSGNGHITEATRTSAHLLTNEITQNVLRLEIFVTIKMLQLQAYSEACTTATRLPIIVN